MEQLILIKLGGSVITDKGRPFYARQRVIRRLGKEIRQAQKRYKGKMIIAHGSGSFGHVLASKYKTHEGLVDKDSLQGLAETADVAAQINRIVVYNLLKVGLKVVSFAPGSFIVAKSQSIHKFFPNPISHCLEIDATPVVYGDVVMDIARGFCIFSAEKVINVLVKGLGKDYRITRIIHCGRTDGVYDKGGKTISAISPRNFGRLESSIGKSNDVDVTGGMLHKVEESLGLARQGIRTVIINGAVRGELLKALLGKRLKGTKISSE